LAEGSSLAEGSLPAEGSLLAEGSSAKPIAGRAAASSTMMHVLINFIWSLIANLCSYYEKPKPLL
jgi:hypothetical protein